MTSLATFSHTVANKRMLKSCITCLFHLSIVIKVPVNFGLSHQHRNVSTTTKLFTIIILFIFFVVTLKLSLYDLCNRYRSKSLQCTHSNVSSKEVIKCTICD